jgi:hypothetical protein
VKEVDTGNGDSAEQGEAESVRSIIQFSVLRSSVSSALLSSLLGDTMLILTVNAD